MLPRFVAQRKSDRLEREKHVGGVSATGTSHVVLKNAPSYLARRQSHTGDIDNTKGTRPSPYFSLSSGWRGCKPSTCAGGSWNQPSAGSCTAAPLARGIEREREKMAPQKGSAVGAVTTTHYVERFFAARSSRRWCSRAPSPSLSQAQAHEDGMASLMDATHIGD